MTTPVTTFTDAVNTFYGAFDTQVANAQAAVNTTPPGAVQSGIDFDVLGTVLLDFGQVAADAVNVFAQDFEAIISETLAAIGDVLSAGILASSIVSNIEEAISIGVTAGAGAAPAAIAAAASGGAAAPAATVTVSSVLAQVQQQATTNLTLLNTVFQNTKGGPLPVPTGNEGQFLGGQILFQQNVSAFLNSLPSSLSATNDSNMALINTLQNLLLVEQDLNNTLSQIETNDNYEQPIALTGLNVVVVLDDALILTDVAAAAITYAFFAYEALSKELVTVSAPGAYTVPVPSGAKFVDIVLSGAGGGGGGYATAGTGGTGGDTTATPTGGSTLTAAGGLGGASSETATASAGGSPGDESFDGYTYGGGNGGAAGSNSVGGNGTAPGGGGGGGGAFGSYGGTGGKAGAWAAQTIAITSGTTEITGSVGAGGTGGTSTDVFATGGSGGNGEAFFRFYS